MLLNAAAGLAVAVSAPIPAPAQGRISATFSAQAVPTFTAVDPVPGGRSLSEVRVAHPLLAVHAGLPTARLRLTGVLNLDGATVGGGELTPGAWGEGFVDRRHPHTYVHELVLAAELPRVSGVAVGLAVGKGFAPFGTDDPMTRPVHRYPVNHHLAQILERAIAVVAARTGPVSVEAGLFNGDEPERPGQWPRVGNRFGDSWSARVTVEPADALELQASRAHVASPEHRPGAGTDQSKWSISARWDGPVAGRPVYGLLEWARTSEAEGFFVFRSVLAEGAWTSGRHRLHYRFERTERPEEERADGAFRSARPHTENTLIGRTRWTIHTAGYGIEVASRPLTLAPFLELSVGRVRELGAGVFDPVAQYGRDTFWALSAGARLAWNGGLHRMGRYGPGTGSGAHGGHGR